MKKNSVLGILTAGAIGGLCGWAVMDIITEVKDYSHMKRVAKKDWDRLNRESKNYYIMVWCLYDGNIDRMAYHIHKDVLRQQINDYLNSKHVKFDTDSVVTRTTVLKYLKCMKPYIKKEVKVTFKK